MYEITSSSPSRFDKYLIQRKKKKLFTYSLDNYKEVFIYNVYTNYEPLAVCVSTKESKAMSAGLQFYNRLIKYLTLAMLYISRTTNC